MRVNISHRIRGRIRLSSQYNFDYEKANKLKYLIQKLDGVKNCKVSIVSGSIIINYKEKYLVEILKYIKNLKFQTLSQIEIEDPSYIPMQEKDLFHIIRDSFEIRFFVKNFLPAPIGKIAVLVRAFKFIKKGIKSLLNKKLNVEVLDATAIGVSILSRDFKTAASTIFLLNLGEELEDWTLKKSQIDLKRSLSINVDKVFVVENDKKYIKNLKDVEIGDVVEVTMGSTIPVDGVVVSGIGMVNQSSFTGESIPIKKSHGKSVFQGTVLEEGMILVKTTRLNNQSRLNNIIKLISENESNKSQAQKQAENMADSLVKFSFFGFLASYLFNRNIQRAKAFLMVDYSCALKLTMPIATMTAMSQLGKNSVLVKGGKYLEGLTSADTIIFDKTGTLTKSTPNIEKIIAFDDYTEDECLRIAACLEEHYPHSIANSVVKAAVERGLNHEEMHSETEYIVAHGISSKIEDKKALIGSSHFIFEDQKVNLTEEKSKIINQLKENYSLLYLAIDNELIAVLCISDPLRSDAKETIKELRKLGIKNIAMLTGDAENAARFIAEELDLDYYKSQVLPEDKLNYIKEQKNLGKKVIMIGDGINDSLALSGADIGISMYKGADIAREISDIAIGNDDLKSIIDTIKISAQLQKKIKSNYNKIIGFNTFLIGLGYYQIIAAQTSALLHNTSTVLIALDNMNSYKIK